MEATIEITFNTLMNLIWFILSKPQNRYEKIRKFFGNAVCTHKRVKYRDVMSKRSDE